MLYTAGIMKSDMNLYLRAATVGIATYILGLVAMGIEFRATMAKEILTVILFPLCPAVVLATAANLNLMKPPMKRYFWRFTVGMIAYVLGLVLANRIYTPESSYKYWLILLPVVPIIYLVTAIVRGVSDMDEMKRKIVTEAAAFACLATGFTCFSYLFFRDMGAPEFHGEWAFYLMWFYYMIGLFFSWRRYK
jgi:hypothetical protein